MNTIKIGDCRETMRQWHSEGKKVQMCVTSPPYFGLRDYGVDGQLGLEQTPEEYVSTMVDVFRCVKHLLVDDGVLWLNIGDSYAGSGKGRNADGTHQEGGKQGTNKGTVTGSLNKTKSPNCKPKDLIGIPWMLAFALRADGWYLRQDIIWHKPNAMPESVKDRCTKSHEYLFLLSKNQKYYFDAEAIKEPAKWERWGNQTEKKKHTGTAGHLGNKTLEELPIRDTKNRRSVWSIPTKPYKGAHFATFPPTLIEPCILAGSKPGDIILDPFMGSGTTAMVAQQQDRNYLGCELNSEYEHLWNERLIGDLI